MQHSVFEAFIRFNSTADFFCTSVVLDKFFWSVFQVWSRKWGLYSLLRRLHRRLKITWWKFFFFFLELNFITVFKRAQYWPLFLPSRILSTHLCSSFQRSVQTVSIPLKCILPSSFTNSNLICMYYFTCVCYIFLLHAAIATGSSNGVTNIRCCK